MSAALLKTGRHAIVTLDQRGQINAAIELPGRGHDFALRPDGLTVAFARRPGTFAVAFHSARPNSTTHIFSAARGRHFNGHGAFSEDGRLLYASENDFERGVGVIGVYDASSFERIGELDSGGIGPHEILRLPNGLLAVANGGIETHPDFPRAKLNLATMRPNLAYLKASTGDIVERREWRADLRQLSIRHMTSVGARNDTTVWFGCQWVGDAGTGVPLVGYHRRGDELALLPAPESGWQSMNDYIGSVAHFANGTRIAASSPRGNRIAIWTIDGRFERTIERQDVSGLSKRGNELVFTDGLGATSFGAASDARAFDNHLRTLS
ncbi:MAG: DUF1513 domain-containing protein [Pseudomonadota bacterium]